MPLLLALLLLLVSPAEASVPGGRLTLTHDGLSRTAIVDAAPGTRDAPLLLVLHGGIGGPEMVRRRAGVSVTGQGWVVAYPQAEGDWSDGRVYPWGSRVSDVDDVGFLRALVGDLADRGLVDPEQVFVAGPSIGGMMALRLLCEAPDLVAGVAVAIASLPRGYDCPEGPPRPVLLLHSTDDSIVPPEGGRIGGNSLLIRERGSVRPVAETAAMLSARNGCTGFAESPLPDRDPQDGTTALRRVYAGCDAPFEHLIVQGGGHTWPGDRPWRRGNALIRSLVGATSQDFSATRAVEAFFAEAVRARDQAAARPAK